MELMEAINRRRTIHSFKPIKVSDEKIIKAINAANNAPCHRLSFPWRFNIVSDSLRNIWIQEISNIDLGNNGMSSGEDPYNKFKNPSHLIIVTQNLNKDPIIYKEDYAACSCAIQNLMLSLTEDGLGTKWSTGKKTRSEITYKLTGLNKEKEEIIGFIWIGIPSKINDSIKRPAINTIIRYLN
tara:strand:+ start:133 stop:681 length:549 start_codon:yes stop_codon:yes gene_type:complete